MRFLLVTRSAGGQVALSFKQKLEREIKPSLKLTFTQFALDAGISKSEIQEVDFSLTAKNVTVSEFGGADRLFFEPSNERLQIAQSAGSGPLVVALETFTAEEVTIKVRNAKSEQSQQTAKLTVLELFGAGVETSQASSNEVTFTVTGKNLTFAYLPAFVTLETFEDPISVPIGEYYPLTRSNELLTGIAVEKVQPVNGSPAFKVYIDPALSSTRFEKTLKKFQREFLRIGPQSGIWAQIIDFDDKEVKIKVEGFWINFPG